MYHSPSRSKTAVNSLCMFSPRGFMVLLRVHQSPAWLRHGTAKPSGRFDPLLHDHFDVGQRLHVGRSVRRAPRQLWHFRDEGLIGLAPIKDDLVADLILHGLLLWASLRHDRISPRLARPNRPFHRAAGRGVE